MEVQERRFQYNIESIDSSDDKAAGLYYYNNDLVYIDAEKKIHEIITSQQLTAQKTSIEEKLPASDIPSIDKEVTLS